MNVVFLILCISGAAKAQPPSTQPGQMDPLLQIMISQPSIDVTSNVQITAEFDPPTVRPGQLSIYRVSMNALSSSVEWREPIASPPELNLKFSTSGQTLCPGGAKLRPLTTFSYHAHPTASGVFIVPGYEVRVYGRRFTVPAAELKVNPTANYIPPRRLLMEISETNVFLGQPVQVRVLMLGQTPNVIEGLADVDINGEGFLLDRGTAQQRISTQMRAGQPIANYIYEATLRPLVTGDETVFAQGFTSGNHFMGQITITGGQITIPGGVPQYVLLESDPFVIHVRPLPRTGELPGFSGAIGRFSIDAPQLSTNRVRIGDVVKLSITIRGDGNLARLVPPRPPVSKDWQVTSAVQGAPVAPGSPNRPGPATTFIYTLIPIAADSKATPAIPFSAFDPDGAKYIDLTIPPLPIQVFPAEDPIDPAVIAKLSEDNSTGQAKLGLSDLSDSPGSRVKSLVPLQLQVWFIGVQLLPVIGLVALWRWDKRRRFLEQHPEIVLRRQARRALQRQRRELRIAHDAGDAGRFVTVAVNAMRVAAAPHFPAESRALVGRDILEVLASDSKAEEVVQRFFRAADAACFSVEGKDAGDLLKLSGSLEYVLDQLEAKL